MAKKWENENITPAQKAIIERRNAEVRLRNSEDMRLLLKLPQFLRYIGRWTQECGVHTWIEGNESSNVMFREGMRKVGERMAEEIKVHDFDAFAEAEKMMRRDEKIRHRIVRLNMSLEDAKDEKPVKGDKHE